MSFIARKKRWMVQLSVTRMRDTQEVAVFTSQPSNLLEKAAFLCQKEDTKVHFCSSIHWEGVENLLEFRKQTPIYFSEGKDATYVSYVGILEKLNNSLTGFEANDGAVYLYEGSKPALISTVFTVSALKKLPQPFLAITLKRLLDGENLPANYSMDYVLVLPHQWE
jgi:hypothetical protein